MNPREEMEEMDQLMKQQLSDVDRQIEEYDRQIAAIDRKLFWLTFAKWVCIGLLVASVANAIYRVI